MLRQRMIPSKRVLTKDNKRIMNQMMVLYKLTNVDIENCVLWALTEENELDIEEFKNACHDLFTATQKQSAIHLTNKSHEVLDKGNNPKKPLTQEEKLIQKLEVISPQQLLADLSSGNQASPQDMKLVREVMATQGLPAPVMNVLIHYVLLQSDMRLSKAYLETIASHWSRANLTTAREAMEFAKKQQEKFTKERSKKQSYRSYQQPALKKEIVPEWFKEQKKEAKQKQSRETEQATVVDLQKQKEEIAAFIKKQTANQRK
ncbi:DnaD domain protein [Paracerasibacillus soli]|uniref:DnaD domain protein n=2 Tax=Paracerasibacillus soli TaxID=480284 RepID=A0ABU5CT91_9BACI|nr:DnaD domain protein [Virgibacillus soli]MDY0408638.1 DnaD domain protein [Virgibacillus soli]